MHSRYCCLLAQAHSYDDHDTKRNAKIIIILDDNDDDNHHFVSSTVIIARRRPTTAFILVVPTVQYSIFLVEY